MSSDINTPTNNQESEEQMEDSNYVGLDSNPSSNQKKGVDVIKIIKEGAEPSESKMPPRKGR